MTESNMQLKQILYGRPKAMAQIRGDSRHPNLRGRVRFYMAVRGVIVYAEVFGLPFTEEACKAPVFALHIHDGFSCAGSALDPPFPHAGSHYNPHLCEHPFHAGDLPPLFGNRGYALSIFLTDRISIDEIIGKTIIVHSGVDDFTSQPAGNSGSKIGCGEIRRFY